ncbi:hypothetical protein CPB83DRAFT_806762 [Crepidotus variabilis]|uniref:Uncharacterized protein n=1 Tax=Crepidotus variabilis TaxID=179855 RepID=A0A9P6EQU8_9AGAR|nr:hypothetical protein CPB83DRAFT_806762 [Crepidotus variabilis]
MHSSWILSKASSSQAKLINGAFTRLLHVSTRRQDFVAPPHPISHMRPILYDDPPSQSPAPYLRHPYSLSEFKEENKNAGNDCEFQFQVQRQQLDALHQGFWLDSNSRFYAAKEEVLRSLPESATALDKEVALSTFFSQWSMQEKSRTEDYTKEWRRRNFELIKIGTRVELQNFTRRVSSVFTRSAAAPKQP